MFLIARQEGPIKRQPHITSWKAIPGKQSGQVFTFYNNRVGIQDTIELLREYEPSVYREMLT